MWSPQARTVRLIFLYRFSPCAAASTSQHPGRPVQAHADIHEREAECGGPPIWSQRAACVLRAVQPLGGLQHQHVCYWHAEVTAT